MKHLDQPWQYSISRNVTIWHNSLTLVGSLCNYTAYRLPNLKHVRIHRGFHSDFYMLANGEGSQQNFVAALQENFRTPEYLDFLQTIYKKNGEELLILARNTTADYESIRHFFDFYAYCICMLDITAQASKVVTNHILTLFKNDPNAVEIISAYGAPKSLAPVQEMERALEDLIGKGIDMTLIATELAAKYGWIPVNFVGELWGVDYFIERIKNYVPEKRETKPLPEVALTDEQHYYLNLIGEIAVLNEYRKSIFTRVNVIIRPVFDQIGTRMGLESWKDVGLCLHQEILDFLEKGTEPNQAGLAERQKLCLIFGNENDEASVLYGHDVTLFEEQCAPKIESISEVRGMIANKGTVSGVAKIIFGPEDFFSFNAGDILIAKMTSVDFIPIMKKAGAFVTDEGGLASHAAIVAREYGKPCIIGTKIGTKIFQNGECVEVDAEKGIVRKI